MNNTITKKQLIEQLRFCQDKKISPQDLQDWMINHYDPPETQIGIDEDECVAEAMNIVMNEYELVKMTSFKIEGIQLALEFLNSTEETFEAMRRQFLFDGFSD